MISDMEINDVATFQGQHTLDGLKKCNYIFGANGTGKTSISRILDKPLDFPSCFITWEGQNPLETYVYNRDFIARNFNQQNLSGIFTLGESSQETKNKINETKRSIEELNIKIEKLTNKLQGTDGKGGKIDELAKNTQDCKKKFFKIKQKYAKKLSGNKTGEGMKGFISSQDKFMEKVLNEFEQNTAALLPLDELEEKTSKIFLTPLVHIDPLPEINFTTILEYEKNPILQKRIIGKNDVDIAAMIKKLNNSDWVHQGLSFYNANDSICPFCQQATNETFQKSISDYFDETLTQDSNTVKSLSEDYSIEASRIQTEIQNLIDSNNSFLNTDLLKKEKQLLDSIIKINNQKLLDKQKEGSKVIELNSLENISSEITNLITEGNTRITENNRVFDNLKTEKEILTAQIWKFVISELNEDIVTYNKKKTNLDKTISNIETTIEIKKLEKAEKETLLKTLEKQITSIIPTKDGINNLLDIFGFKNFKLDLGEEANTYKLVREDGSDAKYTLSEGERNFLTFLYFYYLLKGSHTETGILNNKVVVIDDPISSLDNNVLFIVSSLVRELIQDVHNNNNNGHIQQIFILTHNIYFHKEVCFNKNRGKNILTDETFWLIKKIEKISKVEKQTENPIKSSYELLWDEVRKDSHNNATIQNTLRRILENYFKLLGGIPLNDLYQKFDGEDKIKCKALCSWVNDGSHSVFDEDFYTPLDDTMVLKFLEIFKQIFQKTGQIAHYNMMMGITSEEEQPTT